MMFDLRSAGDASNVITNIFEDVRKATTMPGQKQMPTSDNTKPAETAS